MGWTGRSRIPALPTYNTNSEVLYHKDMGNMKKDVTFHAAWYKIKTVITLTLTQSDYLFFRDM